GEHRKKVPPVHRATRGLLLEKLNAILLERLIRAHVWASPDCTPTKRTNPTIFRLHQHSPAPARAAIATEARASHWQIFGHRPKLKSNEIAYCWRNGGRHGGGRPYCTGLLDPDLGAAAPARAVLSLPTRQGALDQRYGTEPRARKLRPALLELGDPAHFDHHRAHLCDHDRAVPAHRLSRRLCRCARAQPAWRVDPIRRPLVFLALCADPRFRLADAASVARRRQLGADGLGPDFLSASPGTQRVRRCARHGALHGTLRSAAALREHEGHRPHPPPSSPSALR